jgi:hypothetical protein
VKPKRRPRGWTNLKLSQNCPFWACIKKINTFTF